MTDRLGGPFTTGVVPDSFESIIPSEGALGEWEDLDELVGDPSGLDWACLSTRAGAAPLTIDDDLERMMALAGSLSLPEGEAAMRGFEVLLLGGDADPMFTLGRGLLGVVGLGLMGAGAPSAVLVGSAVVADAVLRSAEDCWASGTLERLLLMGGGLYEEKMGSNIKRRLIPYHEASLDRLPRLIDGAHFEHR